MGHAVSWNVSDISRNSSRRKDYITEERVYVTPTAAKKWLGLNTDNYRTMSKANVSNLTRALRLGLFQPGACGPVAFHEEGYLADGQHRLMAIVVSGVGAWLSVRWGLKDSDIIALDSGKRRTARDRIKRLGLFTKPTLVAPASRFMVQALTDGFATAVHGRKGISDAVQVKFCIAESEALEFATASMTSRRRSFDGNKALHVLRVIAYQDHADRVEEFTQSFVSGANLSQRSPILALRNRLSELRAEADEEGKKQDFRELGNQLMFLAWNKWMEGRSATKLRRPSKLVVPIGWDSWVPKAEDYNEFEEA